MMKNNNRLIKTARKYMAILLGSLSIVIIVATLLIIFYPKTDNRMFLYSLVLFFIIFIIAYVTLCVLFIRRIHSLYYTQIYENTYLNIKKIENNDANLTPYKNLEYDEIRDLNDATLSIKDKLTNAVVINKDPDYSKLSLEFLDKQRNIVDFDSFKKEIKNIIFISQSFRNVLIEVYYDLQSTEISKTESNRLMDLFIASFASYPHALFMYGSDNKSLFIYLPIIDSFSNIKEILERTRQNSTIMTREARGLVATPAKYAIVAYPYSTEEYIFSDLRYAKRQNKAINVFLPNRMTNNTNKEIIMNTSMNINHISKLLNNLALINVESIDVKEYLDDIYRLFDELSKYINIDNVGIISYNEVERTYYDLASNTTSTLFKGNKNIDHLLINAMEMVKDDDNSYYFSSRKHVNYDLGRELDRYNISSGYYFVVKDSKNQVVGIIYYFNNNDKKLILNSYIREALYIISLRISHLFEKTDLLDTIDMLSNENDYILSLSPYALYKVDVEYKITYISRRLKKMFRQAKVGEYCYKALFNLDKPCSDCPLRTSKKRLIEVKNKKYEVSLALNDYNHYNRTLLLETLDKNEAPSGDLFNRDLLIYSYRALDETINNEYLSSNRGYVTLLTFDNYEDLLYKKGSEELLFLMRTFIYDIKHRLKVENVYYYNPTTIAIHFPLLGHADIIDRCEVMYELSKMNKESPLNITYLPMAYPGGYANASDFFSHMQEFVTSPKYERNKDYIYFYNYNISRSASKRSFILSVIEDEFSGHSTTSVNLQPIVRVKDRHMFGAEILLRINDVQRNAVFNAFEISKIAEEENKTALITESIVNFIGDMYSEYGKNIFAINEFNRICINIDKTYINDINLVKSISKLIKANNIPNYFISFEIPENIIHDNIEEIKKLANELKSVYVYFSVDRYTGEHVGVDLLKEIGFNEIKIARDIIANIDKDSLKYRELADIVENAHSVNINVAAVGVENEAQFNLLKDLDENMMVQGYYLYKPLSRSDLIAAIVSYSK